MRERDFRYGSKPDLPPFDRDVRFAALNGPKSDIARGPKSANMYGPAALYKTDFRERRT